MKLRWVALGLVAVLSASVPAVAGSSFSNKCAPKVQKSIKETPRYKNASVRENQQMLRSVTVQKKVAAQSCFA